MGVVHGVAVERAQQSARSAEHFLLRARARQDASARHDAVGEVEGEGPKAGIVQAPGGAERRLVGDDDVGLGESCTGSRGQGSVRRMLTLEAAAFSTSAFQSTSWPSCRDVTAVADGRESG